MDDLAARIVANLADLEEDVQSRRMFAFWAKREFERWKFEKAELEILLEQVDGYVHSLRVTWIFSLRRHVAFEVSSCGSERLMPRTILS